MILPDVNVLLYAFRNDAVNHAAYRPFARVLLEQPTCTMVQPGPRHWSIFEGLCRRSSATGNLAQDAWFAALALECGCQWMTTDRDCTRFPGLRWRPPF